MAPHEIRRLFKRSAISNQQKRRDLALLRQAQQRADSQNRARSIATSVLSLLESSQTDDLEPVTEGSIEREEEYKEGIDFSQASRLKGSEAKKWFSRQLMIPEWMIDIPYPLSQDWSVIPLPKQNQKCFKIKSDLLI